MGTLSSDPVGILIASDAWGTREVLRACAGLTRDQFHRAFPIGLGSLHDTLTHVVGTMRRWTDRLAERPLRPSLLRIAAFPHIESEAKERTPGELGALLDEAERDLLATADRYRGALGTTVSLEWPGEEGAVRVYTFTRGAVFVHVTTHGYHHRAQCLNMLRQLGAPVPGVTEGWPEPSAVDWQAAFESPPVVRKGHGA